MGISTVRVRSLVLVGLVGLLVTGGAQAASAHRTPLSVQIISDQSSLAPDGRSMTFYLETVCDRTWTIVEASVTVTQPQASGKGSFSPTCGRIPYNVQVRVPVTSGTFQTGSADVTAVLVVQQGPTKRAQDSATLRARPDVSVVMADPAVLQGDGAVLIDVTVTCPMSAVGRGGFVQIYDGPNVGRGSFGPTPCDAVPHTVSVRVVPDGGGSFRVGTALALADATITEGGDFFTGSDFRDIQIVSG
jgi:hypothetical protein